MASVSRAPLYDPANHPYPKMIYPASASKKGGVVANSEDEELAILTAWDEQDKAAGKSKSEAAKAKA